MKLPSPDEIIRLMKKPKYYPLRAREIFKRLAVPKESRKIFKKILRKLVLEGKVTRIRGGRYVLSDGVGEVGDVEKIREVKEENKPLPTNSLNRMPREGKILGKFIRTGKTGIVLPKNGRIPSLIVKLNEVKGLRSGSLVVAETLRLSKRSGRPIGKVVDVLGKAGTLDVEKKGLFVDYNLPEEFPSEVMKESQEIPSQILEEDLAGRVDLRGFLIVTIDNDTAKDFDDAVGISQTDSGYKLWVSIADVPYYVKIGTAVDNEALQRGTSIYLPESVIPMLPERLSNHICSLVPSEDRLTKTVEMDFDQQGIMVNFKIYNSVIRSGARLTYTQVSEMLEKKRRFIKKDKELVDSLKIMKELYEKIRERSIAAGKLDFNIAEPELIRDELGRTVDVVKSQRNIAHGIIEEFMIAANNAVAEFIFRSRSPSIYRIHELPDIAPLKELAAALNKLGYFLRVDTRLKSLDIQKVIFESKDTPEELAVNTMLLRSLKRAVYSTEVKGHFGLALDHYTHFTSPIRRYPDLVVHRIINSLINGRRVPYDEESLEWIATHSSARERFAVEVEREARNLERVFMMKSHVGEEFEGFVISILPFGIFVELKEIFVEGFVPREKIRRGRWFEIGHQVRVRVIEADVERRRITLELVS
jgi:ribonuclease R